MEYPQLNKNPGGKIELKDFTGGINTARNPLLLQDDQVPEVKNMVPFRGILTTRRKFELGSAPATDESARDTDRLLRAELRTISNGEYVSLCTATFDYTSIHSGDSHITAIVKSSESKSGYEDKNFETHPGYALNYTASVRAGCTTYKRVAHLGNFSNTRIVGTKNYENYLGKIDGDYLWTRHTDIIAETVVDGEFHIIRIFADWNALDTGGSPAFGDYEPIFGYTVEDEKLAYVPTVITGKSLDGTLATPLEDFNLLTPAFKEEFFPRASIVAEGLNEWTTVHPTANIHTPYIRLNLSQQDLDDDDKSFMICELWGVFEFSDSDVSSYYAKAELVHKERPTTVKFKFYDGEGWERREVAANDDAIRFNANMKNGFADIRFDWRAIEAESGGDSDHNADAFFTTCYIEKIALTARKRNPMYDTVEDAKTFDLINTSIQTLYGGTRSGIADGTRRFFAGYPEGNLIRWSGLNDITYLPENNFAYVGDDADITALGKQYGALIVFKENSTYNMEYTYSVEDGATTVLFPITPISNEYGCDNPGTLQLVNDRLVWCNTNGRVYILYSQYQYTRKNIADIGGNVYDLLKDNPPTFAAVWDKMYFLFSSVESGGSYVNTAVIWDFDQSTYYNYYSNEKSQDRLSWFYWDITEITEQLTAAQTFEDVLYLNGVNYYELSEDLMDSCSIKTKEFDFGVPTQLKNIRRIDIMAEIIEAQTVQVDYFGDNGTILYSDYRAISEIGNVVIILRPHILRLRTFSVRITGTKLSIQGIIITADTAGRLR